MVNLNGYFGNGEQPYGGSVGVFNTSAVVKDFDA
jgi:hypothetical protein